MHKSFIRLNRRPEQIKLTTSMSRPRLS